MDFKEDDRPIRLTTPLGANKLFPLGVSGQEGLSELFSFTVEAVSPDATPIDFKKLLGNTVTVSIDVPPDTKRYVNGIVQSVTQGAHDPERNITHYFLKIVPQLWLFTRNIQSRIFQNKTVPDIIREVCAGVNLRSLLSGDFKPREYCVQFQESDFAFVSRLMEAEGIFYYFKHTQSGHEWVLANKNSVLDSIGKVDFDEAEGGAAAEASITEWLRIQDYRSGKYAMKDWNFKTPSTDLLVTDDTVVKLQGNSALEVYEYPGAYMEKGDGDEYIKLRMEEEEAQSLSFRGESSHGGFSAGAKFTFSSADGYYTDSGKDFVLTRVGHSARQPLFLQDAATPFEYKNGFTCISNDTPFRPLRLTPAPRARGLHSAIVTGPSGEEIYTDEYGRIKVQFQWDRLGNMDGNSSCWIRVATFWAGKQWGAVHIPRIGQEVIVDFIDGDIDRPLVVGSVYNQNTMPPYTLPDNMTQSGVKSRSSKGGGAANYNELRFEDRKGSELVTLHAEKDQSVEVEHDETHWVGHDRTKKVDHDETTTVAHNRTETVGNNEGITIGNDRTETVGHDETITIGNSRTKSVGTSETVTVGSTLSITAGVSISLTVGGSNITIDQSGVKIKGAVLVSIDGIMTKVNGSGLLKETGGIIMLN